MHILYYVILGFDDHSKWEYMAHITFCLPICVHACLVFYKFRLSELFSCLADPEHAREHTRGRTGTTIKMRM